MALSDDEITEIFYLVDEFCISFEKTIQKHLIGNKPKRTPKMSCSQGDNSYDFVSFWWL